MLSSFCSSLLFILFTFLSLNTKAQEISDFAPKVTTWANLKRVAVQQDGKVIAQGALRYAGDNEVDGIARFNADGTYDESFKVDFRIKGTLNEIIAQSDGKILLAGNNIIPDGPDVIRLNSDGSIDDSFELDEYTENIWKIIEVEDGKYLAASPFPPQNLIKLTSDGKIDETFQIAEAAFPTYNSVSLSFIDGMYYVIGGFSTYNDEPASGIIRLDKEGKRDTGFDIGFGAGGSFSGLSLEKQGTDKLILSGGFNWFNGNSVNGIIRLNIDGSFDESFNTAENEYNPTSAGRQAYLLPNGKILYIALKNDGVKQSYSLQRLDENGFVETDFGEKNLFHPLGNTSPQIDIAISPVNDHIFVAGTFTEYTGDQIISSLSSIDFDGELRTSFDPRVADIGIILSSAQQEDGKIVIGGDFTHVNNIRSKNLARLNGDGSLDEEFTTNIGTGTDQKIEALSMHVDEKILVGGNFEEFNGQPKNGLLRLNTNGTIDTGFNTKILSVISTGGVELIQPLKNGKIIVGGAFSSVNDVSITALARLEPDGELDASFNQNDIISGWDALHAIDTSAYAHEGHFLISGLPYTRSSDPFLYRLNQDGDIVSTFPDLDLSEFLIEDIQKLSSGNILLAGHRHDIFPDPARLMVIDLEENIVTDEDLGETEGPILDALVFADDKILISGDFNKVNDQDRAGLALLDANFNLLGLNALINRGENTFVNKRAQVLNLTKTDNSGFIASGYFPSVGDSPRSSIVQMSLNDIPEITGTTATLSTGKNTPLRLTLGDLTVEDSDNDYPNDYTLSIHSGNNYQTDGIDITPQTDFLGTLTVPVSVSDGINNSPVYTVEVLVELVASTFEAPYRVESHVFPNPAQDNLKVLITRPLARHKSATLALITSQGQNVKEDQLIFKQNQLEYNLDLRDLEEGLYLLHIIIDNKVIEVKKILVTNR